MYRFNQHSFVGGQLDRGLMGRQDLERYFQGASKLENFIVRKQGNITKRRGTEMIADLSDLFGTGNAIAYSRIIPFSQEITEGYYLLLAEEDNPAAGEESSSGGTTIKGAYVLSDKGLLHQVTTTKSFEDKTETSKTHRWLKTCTHDETTGTEERDGEDGMVQTWTVAESVEPFRIEVPYNGAEFKEIGFNQSGDTLFLVHKNHPPAKVVNGGKNTFTYEILDFSSQTWQPPRILSISQSGTAGTGAEAVVTYVATYVKNGVESLPSEPFDYTYKLPWANTYALTIKMDKGANAEEPDYYNVYKSTGADFGIISSIGTTTQVYAYPTLKNTSPAYFSGWGSAGPLTDLLNTAIPAVDENGMITTDEVMPGGYYGGDPGTSLFYGRGATTTGTLLVEFPKNSGIEITKFFLSLGAYIYFKTDNYDDEWTQEGERYYNSHPYYKATLTCSTQDGSYVKSFTLSATCKRPSYPFGWNQIDPFYQSWDAKKFAGQQSPVFDFSELINADSKLKARYEVVSLEVSAYSDSAMKNQVNFAWCGLSFYSGRRLKDAFRDDYITPNLAFTPPQASENFIKSGDYPSCVALYTQRLAFAASTNQPFTWWMSCVGDLYNFNTHASIRQDDALEVTVPATEFPNINHMVLSRDLVLFCDNGEWLVRPLSGNTLAYDTVECKKQSAIGCAKGVSPLQVGDEIIFVDNSRRTIRSIKYQFTSDGYESNDLSILSQSLFFSNPAVSMCYKQHPESLILCELADGTVAALVYMKEHSVIAWTHHTLGGGWKCRGIASNKAHADETTHVAMLVEHPDGGTEVWRVRDDDESGDLAAQLCMDGLKFAKGSEIGVAAFDAANGQLVVDLETGLVVGRHEDLAADVEYAIGYPFTSTFVSVRPEPQGAETFQWELKNAKKVNIRTLNGSSFTVKEAGMGDEYASKVEIERNISNGEITTPGLVDATDILLNGENSRDGRIEIKHDGILPLTIESFAIDYETQPLYGSEG